MIGSYPERRRSNERRPWNVTGRFRPDAYAWRRIERAQVAGRTLTLKVKFADFSIISRAATRTLPIATRDEIAETGATLLRRMFPVDQGIRLLGLTLAGFEPAHTTSSIVEPLLPPV